MEKQCTKCVFFIKGKYWLKDKCTYNGTPRSAYSQRFTGYTGSCGLKAKFFEPLEPESDQTNG